MRFGKYLVRRVQGIGCCDGRLGSCDGDVRASAGGTIEVECVDPDDLVARP